MRQLDFRKTLVFSAAASLGLFLSSASSAQEIQIDTNQIEKPAKIAPAKKSKETNKLTNIF